MEKLVDVPACRLVDDVQGHPIDHVDVVHVLEVFALGKLILKLGVFAPVRCLAVGTLGQCILIFPTRHVRDELVVHTDRDYWIKLSIISDHLNEIIKLINTVANLINPLPHRKPFGLVELLRVLTIGVVLLKHVFRANSHSRADHTPGDGIGLGVGRDLGLNLHVLDQPEDVSTGDLSIALVVISDIGPLVVDPDTPIHIHVVCRGRGRACVRSAIRIA